MVKIKDIVISSQAPTSPYVGWLSPVDDGTFRLKFNVNGIWLDAASGLQGPKGDTGATGPKGDKGDKGDKGETGAAGKYITAIALTTDESGKVNGGTATFNDKSTVQITVSQE